MYPLMSRHFPPTRREAKADQVSSYSLLERAGYIRSTASGIFTLLPLGWRVHQRISALIFKAMEHGGVHNLQLPILQPQSIWEQTGRWSAYRSTKTMFTTTEQHSQARFGLAPTSEEVITALAAMEIRSWRDLPLTLHQIGPKFRDVVRPTAGLLRCREFSMSDAYSFDRDEDAMKASYERLRGIYHALFNAVGLRDYVAVDADNGAFGGSGSSSFMAVTENGEDSMFACDACDYRATAEKASTVYANGTSDALRLMERVHTAGLNTPEQMTVRFPGLTPAQMIKSMVFVLDDTRHVTVCIRADREVNVAKLLTVCDADSAVPAAPEVVEQITGAEIGYVGPLGLPDVLFDQSLQGLVNFLCGVNETGTHAINVNWERDLPLPAQFVDIGAVVEGDLCPVCRRGSLQPHRGIEVGHIFMLGTNYSDKLHARYVDDSGTERNIWMGCYGIGTTRLMQAIVEQNHDEHGIVWPARVAPHDVYVVAVNMDEPRHLQAARHACNTLTDAGWSVIYDDRPIRAGAKFMDADLIGVPWRLTSGRRAADGIVELRERRTGQTAEIAIEHLPRVLREKGA